MRGSVRSGMRSASEVQGKAVSDRAASAGNRILAKSRGLLPCARTFGSTSAAAAISERSDLTWFTPRRSREHTTRTHGRSVTLVCHTLPPYYDYSVQRLDRCLSSILQAATQNVIGRAACIHCDGPHISRALNIMRASKSSTRVLKYSHMFFI